MRPSGTSPGSDPGRDRARKTISKECERALPDWTPRPAPELPRDAHKGDAGRVLCICGSRDMPGAAVLVARAAQRAGAGLVTVACRDENLRIVLPVAAPEAVLLDMTAGATRRGRARSQPWKGRVDDARVCGPGLGLAPDVRGLVLDLLRDESSGPLVLDADALNAIGEHLEALLPHTAALVMTPHPGEAARLLGRTIPSDPEGRKEAAREISRRTRGIACLKGHRTVVAEGDRVYVNDTGNPGMATAGAGDVLAGIMVAYLALCRTGIDPEWTPFDAAASAVRVHGLAGDLAAREIGERAVIASDLIGFLPAAQVAFIRASKDRLIRT